MIYIYLVINWLAKKSIPSSDAKKGDSAGFMFYETSEGFHFKSIDSLFAQEHVSSYIFSNTPDVLENTDQYDGVIVRMELDNRMIANQKYRMGTFSTKLIAFNPFNCEYKIIEQDASEADDGTTHAGKNLPILNEKFNARSTRTTYVLKDVGTLPTGKDPREQVKKHEEMIVASIKKHCSDTKSIKNILEIGFLAGHSADMFLKLNESVVVHSFDNIGFQSVAAGKKYIDQLYPERHILIKGDSKESLPKFIKTNNIKFDIILIDGGYDYDTVISDITNCKNLATSDTILIVNNVLNNNGNQGLYLCMMLCLHYLLLFLKHIFYHCSLV